MRAQTFKRTFSLLLMPVLLGIALTAVISTNAESGEKPESAAGTVQVIEGARGATVTPVIYKPVYHSAPVSLTPAHLERIARMDERRERAEANEYRDPNPYHPVAPPELGKQTNLSQSPLADNTFLLFRNADVSPATSSSSVINEPAHSTNGKFVFFTGNWYAARSANGGATYSYIDPTADFADFCCDQDVIQDPARNLIIWFRQGLADSFGKNQIKLSVSTNGGVSFATYTLAPTTIDASLTNQWLDYPHMATSNNFLYLTSNIYNSSDAATGKILIRIPLAQLAAAASINFVYWKEGPGATITPVQGATTTMYLGSALSSAGTFKVYSQAESQNTLTNVTKTIPAFTATSRNGKCLVPNGRNPCGRSDTRVTAGWVAKGVIGFFWNVKEGGGFTYPYINAATFRESDKTVLGRPYLFNQSFAFHYGAAAPNSRGDIGIACLIAGGNQGYPKFVVGLDDDYVGAWTLLTAVSSTNWGFSGSGGEGAGDYLRVRAHNPASTIWTASGYYGLGNPVFYRGRFAAFGRDRERRNWNRWGLL
jgi:hypothetical protein